MLSLAMSEPGKALKARREAAGFSQQGLAVLVGMHAASIGQIERGIQNPPRATVAALDRALGASGELLGDFGFLGDELATRLDGLEAGLAEHDRKLEALQVTRSRAMDLMLARFEAMEERVDHLERLAERAHVALQDDSGESG